MNEGTEVVVAFPKLGTIFIHVRISRGVEDRKLGRKTCALRARR